MAGRAGAAAGVALALALTGSACAVIPLGGNPASYREIVKGDPLRKPYVRVVAVPPRPEWTPKQVVTGFLSAMASVDDPGYTVARQYLYGAAAQTWRPDGTVTVYDKGVLGNAPPPPKDATETGIMLKGMITGTIDPEGKYRAVEGAEDTLKDFRLVKTPQGWRIKDFPDGLLLTEDDIRRSYRPVKLYYLDHLQKSLVVDQVRVRVDPSSDFAETMLQRLLRGPTSGLKSAVSNALPAGTRLLGISTEDDKIIVNLNEAATNAISTGPDRDAVSAMAAQIGWTLDQLTERWDVEIRVNGEPYYQDGGALRVGFDRYGSFDQWLNPGRTATYFFDKGALHSLNQEGEPSPVPGVAGHPGADHTEPAVSGGARPVLATLTKGGSAIATAPLAEGSHWEQRITGTNLTRPSWDRYDNIWTVDRVGPRASRVLRFDGKTQTKVSAPGLESVEVRDMRVARDGVRLAAVVTTDTGTEVQVSTITVNGSETTIADPEPLVTAVEGQQIVDIAWQDSTTLLVLTGSKAGKEVLAVDVTDGTSESIKADARITSITALADRILAGAEDTGDDEPELLYLDPVKQTWTPLTKTPATTPLLPLD